METGNTQVTIKKSQFRVTGLKVLSAVGFILVLVFGAWGIVQVGRSLPKLSSALSSAAVSLTSIFVPAERLEINMSSANINSGEPFTLSWSHINKKSTGTYTVSFECRDGLSMQTIGENGVYQTVYCNTPFNFTNATTEMKLIATTEGVQFLDVPFTVAFTRLSDGKVTASTKTALTITNTNFNTATTGTGSSNPVVSTPAPSIPAPTTPAPTTPAPTPTPTPTPVVKPVPTYTYTQVAGRQSDPNGHPDLAVTILDTGVIDSYSGAFRSTNTVKEYDHVAVKFVVENVGTKTVDNWNFNAVLPTQPMNIYSSDMQPALGPGDKMQYTIAFDKTDSYATQGAVTINVDPSNMIWNELSKNNNVARVFLTIVR